MKEQPPMEDFWEAWRLLDLVVAEWESDPQSVQCFDLRIVNQAIDLMKRNKGYYPPK